VVGGAEPKEMLKQMLEQQGGESKDFDGGVPEVLEQIFKVAASSRVGHLLALLSSLFI
jgi:hypothetical protein